MYIQHFPGGYKLKTDIPSESIIPFHLPPIESYGTPFIGGPYSSYSASPYLSFGMYPYSPHNPYQQFVDFLSQRDFMKEHLNKQTRSLNSLKEELESMKKNEYEFAEKVRHGQKQIIPITRSKR